MHLDKKEKQTERTGTVLSVFTAVGLIFLVWGRQTYAYYPKEEKRQAAGSAAGGFLRADGDKMPRDKEVQKMHLCERMDNGERNIPPFAHTMNGRHSMWYAELCFL